MSWDKGVSSLKDPVFDTLKVGDLTAGDYFEVQGDGSLRIYGEGTGWDDIRFPLVGQRLDVSAGRIDYNYDDCSVDFQDNALYDDDPVCFIAQMHHKKLLGSAIELHLHWMQNQDEIPNWLIGYRWINIGEALPLVGAETLVAWTDNIATYSAGNIQQLTEFGSITKPVADTLSSILHIRLFRDTDNDSLLFAGADPYVGGAQAVEFDIHYQIDSLGSREEYVK